MNEWIGWLPSALLVVIGVALALAVVRLRRQVASLVEGMAPPPVVEEVAQQSSRNPATDEEAAYVVTSIAETEPTSDRRIEGSLFADLVLRESVVKSVSFVYGVRRALAPETRNRIRFQMRQEIKRSRKQRRIDVRAARRRLADRRRDEDAA